jgi:hypothetical protein
LQVIVAPRGALTWRLRVLIVLNCVCAMPSVDELPTDSIVRVLKEAI